MISKAGNDDSNNLHMNLHCSSSIKQKFRDIRNSLQLIFYFYCIFFSLNSSLTQVYLILWKVQFHLSGTVIKWNFKQLNDSILYTWRIKQKFIRIPLLYNTSKWLQDKSTLRVSKYLWLMGITNQYKEKR
jgi:hypothetical protein